MPEQPSTDPRPRGREPAQSSATRSGAAGEPPRPEEVQADAVAAADAATSGADAPGREPVRGARADSAVVPVAGVHRQESPRTSFWKRIRLSRRSGVGAATGDDRLLSRLDAIDSRLESGERELRDRIRALDERFSDVWEPEEQLSRLTELREMLADIQERQGRIDSRSRALTRRLSLVTALAATAAVGSLAAAALALL